MCRTYPLTTFNNKDQRTRSLSINCLQSENSIVTFTFQLEERQQWKLEKDTELRLEIPEGKGKAELVVSCTCEYLSWSCIRFELKHVSERK